ncbi:MAG: 50S ribosomal protein L31e [Nanoarchaeota archaeon]
MAKLERNYNVPLRKGFQKAPRYRKSKKAIITLKEFIAKHMKCSLDQIRIGPMLNKKVWEHGIKNPPHHVKITAIKEDDIVKAELFGHNYTDNKVVEEAKDKKETKKEVKEIEEPKADKEEKKVEEKKETTEKKKTAKKPAKKTSAKTTKKVSEK